MLLTPYKIFLSDDLWADLVYDLISRLLSGLEARQFIRRHLRCLGSFIAMLLVRGLITDPSFLRPSIFDILNNTLEQNGNM